MTRRRQSKAFQELTAAAFAEYRSLCLPRTAGGAEGTLEEIVAWLAGQGVTSSTSSVFRDAEYFRAVEEAKDRLRLSRDAAEQIVAAGRDAGGVASTQAAATELLTQQILDLLIREKEIKVDDIGAYSKLCMGVARMTGSQIAVYRAEVGRRAAEAAKAAEALATTATGDQRDQLNKLAADILGVPA